MKQKPYFGKIKIDTVLAEKFNEFTTIPSLPSCLGKTHSEDNILSKTKPKAESLWYLVEKATALTDEFLMIGTDNDLVHILDNLFISNEPTSRNETLLKSNGITHVINLVAKEETKKINEVKYFTTSLHDTPEWSILPTLKDIINFISEGEAEDESSRFLIWWRKGISRSASLMAGYIMHKYKLNLKQALFIIKKKKPSIDPNLGFLGQLKMFEEQVAMSEI